MAHYKTAREDIVPFGQKLAFGSGHLANQLFPAALGVFMVVLVMSLNMNPVLAGILGALPRLLDALTDPIMGFISDNTKSKWGRRKPYILLGSVITGVAFMVMWQLDPEASQTYNFVYFLIVSLFFYIGYTIFATPLIGLGYEMTPDYNERTRLMAVSQWMGQIAWMIAPWFWVIIYEPAIFESAPAGAKTLSIWVGAICMILGIMPALFNKEMIVPNKDKMANLSMKDLAANTKEFIRGIKLTLKNKPFIKLCGATFLIFNGFQTVAQFAMFIIVYYLFSGDKVAAGSWPAWFGTVSAMATAFLVIPIVTKLSEKVGKKNAFIIATLLSIVGYALKWWGFNPANPWLMFMPIPFLSFGIGGLFTLMMSMTADVCDLDELNNGERREGMFGAVYWWMVKLGTALALLTSGVVLSMVGFDQNIDVQTVETLTNLRIADIVIPVVTALMAIAIVWKYNITETRAHEIREALIAQRGKLNIRENRNQKNKWMKTLKLAFSIMIMSALFSCNLNQKNLQVEVFETSASGNQLTKLSEFTSNEKAVEVKIQPAQKFQTITGFGGSFTESSAYLLNQLSKENRELILQAYFGADGAKYSLTRTHINSCDFSLSNYSYAKVEGDKELKHFSIDEDRDDIIPMIKEAMAISEDGFKIISSPWTAPPWMKDNNSYVGGKLLPEYNDTWALFFSKYLEEYKKEGIDIWGLTVENEPLGNGNNWESMHFSPEEMLDFVSNHLGPKLEADGHDVKILSYDQNRDELEEWAKVIYKNEASKKYFDGFAIHWYASTYDYFPEVLQHTHQMAPEKYMIQSEACIDAEVPVWKDDAWYWSKEATDWGWDWAPEEQKHLHPKYVPVYRYARDIIGCLNNWVDGWVDWNMVLDTQGGPNWFKNWCLAPVIVDPEKDEVYFTPLYHTLAHFSRYIRPGAVRIGFENPDEELMITAAQNPDGTIAVVLLNMNEEAKNINLVLGEISANVQISGQAIQTVVVTP